MKHNTLTKIDVETYNKLKQITNEISTIQKTRVPIHETLRRTFNIPNIEIVLKQDAQAKRYNK